MDVVTCKKKVCVTLVGALFLWGSAAGAAEGNFNASVSSSGQVEGGGNGYQGGRWYYYPQSKWYTQWFFNGPYNRDAH